MICNDGNDSRITPKPGRTPTVFRCAAVHANSVFLAGDFNGWSDYATPARRSPDGFWTVALALHPGRYQFKFVVDGQWYHEADADSPYDGRDDCVANPFGTMNRVVEVGQEPEVPRFQTGAIGTELVGWAGVGSEYDLQALVHMKDAAP